MFNFFKRINANAALFNGHFIDAKCFYAFEFNKIPSVTFIGELDVAKTFAFINEIYRTDIKAVYHHSYFNHVDKEIYFNNAIVVLSFERMIELADNYCQLLHTSHQYNWARTLVNELAQFAIEKNVMPTYRRIHVVGFAKETEMN
jgi:hypothetical protein